MKKYLLLLTLFGFPFTNVIGNTGLGDDVIIEGKKYSVLLNTQVDRFHQLFAPVEIFTRTKHGQREGKFWAFLVIKEDLKDIDKKPILDFFATTHTNVTEKVSQFVQQTPKVSMIYDDKATQVKILTQQYPVPFDLQGLIGLFEFYENGMKECGSFLDSHKAIWLVKGKKLYVKELGFYPCNPLISAQVGKQKQFDQPAFASWYSGIFWVRESENRYKTQAIKIKNGQVEWQRSCTLLDVDNRWVLNDEIQIEEHCNGEIF